MGENKKDFGIKIVKPEKRNFFQKLGDKVLGPKIQINEEAKPVEITIIPSEEVDGLIQIIDNEAKKIGTDGEVDIEEAIKIVGKYGDEVAPQIVVTAEINKKAADLFCNRVRSNIDSILDDHLEVTPDSDMFWTDLWQMSNKWGIPMKLVSLGQMGTHGHYTLALKDPEQTTSGNWQVLVYDPMQEVQRMVDLGNSATGNRSVQINGNYYADIESPYNLTIEGDEELAASYELVTAKKTRLQYDVNNCGLMCLMMAGIRTGIKPGFNTFKEAGRDILEQDTRTDDEAGVRILKREEIFGK